MSSTFAPSTWGLAEFFIVSQTAIPAVLYLPGTQPVRFYVRVASFAISIALFAWWAYGNAKSTRPHPAQPWLVASMIYTAAMVLHPFTSSFVGGIAQLVLYVAVMAPVFWAPAIVRGPDHLARLMLLLLVCNGVNALVGVLQVYDPDRWMPQEMSRIVTESAFGLGAVSYRGPNGNLIVRPPGLFDNPGAVAGPGMYAALLGLVFATSAAPKWQRALALGGSFAGVAAIYLSQVRVSLVVLALMLGAYVTVLVLHRRAQRAILFGGIAAGIVVATFTFAISLGGESIAKRTLTLFEQDPMTLYSASRGGQLVYTFDDLVSTYPLGAGLGRWGMIAGYFGSGGQSPLWAEIQVAGWAIDGGIPLVILGVAAPFVALLAQWRLALRDQEPKVRACAAVALAANLGTAALIFSFTPFVTQIGLQFWFLAGALHGASSSARTAANPS
ncbi:MAG TPA: hypothetical protein VH740_08440 [Vicinamibacterales bacterium]